MVADGEVEAAARELCAVLKLDNDVREALRAIIHEAHDAGWREAEEAMGGGF
jgi:hypothetical protein